MHFKFQKEWENCSAKTKEIVLSYPERQKLIQLVILPYRNLFFPFFYTGKSPTIELCTKIAKRNK
jgi:hypothetical protein